MLYLTQSQFSPISLKSHLSFLPQSQSPVSPAVPIASVPVESQFPPSIFRFPVSCRFPSQKQPVTGSRGLLPLAPVFRLSVCLMPLLLGILWLFNWFHVLLPTKILPFNFMGFIGILRRPFLKHMCFPREEDKLLIHTILKG